MAIKEQWSWDEFLGGLAQGGVAGLGAGINLREARDATRAKELAAMELNPEPFLDEYERRNTPALKYTPTATGLDPITNAGDLAAMGIPERRDPINLLDAQQARKPDRRLAFSEDIKKQLEGISDEQLQLFKRKQERLEREVEGTDIKKYMNDYSDANSEMRSLLTEKTRLREKVNEADRLGDPDAIKRWEDSYDKIIEKIENVKATGNRSEAVLREMGLTDLELANLGMPGRRAGTMRDVLMRIKRSPRTRQPGTR